MRLLLHVVAKDFRGLRDRWLFWVGAMAVKIAGALWLVWGPGVDEALYDYFCKSLLVLVPMELALTFLLAAMIIQADPLAGEAAFWRTRPISGARMLAAKMLSLFVLLGLPVCVVALPWWLACGAGPAELISAAGIMLVMQAVVIAPTVLVASLTDSLGRFFVWTLVLVMAHAAGGLIGPLAAAGTTSSAASLNGTRLTTYFVVFVVTGLVVIALQYLGNNRRRSLAVLGAGWAAALAAWLWWPWSFDFEGWNSPHGDEVDVSKVQVAVDGARVSFRAPRSATQSGQGSLFTSLKVSGLAETAYLVGRRSEHVWRWPDGTEFRRNGWGAWGYLPMLDTVRRELRLPEPADEAARRARAPEADQLTVGLNLPRDRVDKLQASPASYALTLDLVALHPRAALEVPLQVDGWRARGGRGVRLLQIAPGGPRRAGTLSLLQAELPQGVVNGLRFPFAGTGADYGAPTLFWVDRATGGLKPLGPRISGLRWSIAGVALAAPVVTVDDPYLRDAAARRLSLVWVEWSSGVPFTRRAAVERFEVK